MTALICSAEPAWLDVLGWSWAGSLAVMTALLWLRAGLAASGALLRRACFKPAAAAAGAPEGGGCRHRLGRWRAVWSGEDEAALRWRRADAAMLLLLYALGVARGLYSHFPAGRSTLHNERSD